MSIKWGTKTDWPVVSARIAPAQDLALKKKHPDKGEVSKVLRALITKYLENKILGLRVE